MRHDHEPEGECAGWGQRGEDCSESHAGTILGASASKHRDGKLIVWLDEQTASGKHAVRLHPDRLTLLDEPPARLCASAWCGRPLMASPDARHGPGACCNDAAHLALHPCCPMPWTVPPLLGMGEATA